MIRNAILACTAIACSATPSFAHAMLEHAQPGAGARLAPSPSAVVLRFTEKLEPVFSGVAVTDRSGHSVEAGPVVVSEKSMAAPLRRLSPGTYRVAWHAVSVDTHRTEGAYSFAIKQ